MKKRIAINGFGRIGRLALRNLIKDNSVEVVAINDLTDNGTLAHLFKYDTAHGTHPADVRSENNKLHIGDYSIPALNERDPSDLPWKSLEVDLVLECTGVFRTEEKVSKHIEAGAKKILLSAPPKGEGFKMIVLGVNDSDISDEHTLYSNASCTTNCLAPLLSVIIDNFGFVRGNMNTVHAYTADQNLQDAPHSDLRRARAAVQNIAPTTTGAAGAAAKVIPVIKNKLFAAAYRVPVITGSLVELSCIVDKAVSVEELNSAFQKAAEGDLKGIIEYRQDEPVSSDIIGNRHSTIFDSKLTQTMDDYIKVTAWYDNEAGYAARLAELASKV
ncbi:MAG: type I glyceraldehyde-3-phosphate dehydrogenase [Saprospiraceae bacterium]|nr:type I glyceraldehyde-3-phosphate dehydrogenase [Saprospiraceae bacterium]